MKMITTRSAKAELLSSHNELTKALEEKEEEMRILFVMTAFFFILSLL